MSVVTFFTICDLIFDSQSCILLNKKLFFILLVMYCIIFNNHRTYPIIFFNSKKLIAVKEFIILNFKCIKFNPM